MPASNFDNYTLQKKIDKPLVGTAAFANMSEVSDAAGFSSPVDFKGAYVGSDSDKTGLGAKGWLYFTDDGTGTIYKHDGSGWVDLGIGGSSVWEDPDGDGVYSLKNGSGISIDELNNGIELLDPEETDFATALDDAVSRASAGDTIIVPTDYTECSGATVDKPVTIRSLGSMSRYYSDTVPTITKTADAPCIESGDDTAIAVIGLHVDASGIADTTPAVTGHGQTLIRDCNATEIAGDPVYYLHQATAGDNLNLSQVLNVSAEDCAGDVVMAENTTGNANNLNSLRIHVQDHKGNAGWAINTGLNDVNASWFLVNSIQGGANATAGGIRFNSQRCAGVVMRHEGSGPTVQFEEPFNAAEVYYDNTGNGATWNNDNNTLKDLSSSGWNVEARYGGLNLRGGTAFVQDGALFVEGGRAKIDNQTAQPGSATNPALHLGSSGAGFYVDGNGDVVVVDTAGNSTVIS